MLDVNVVSEAWIARLSDVRGVPLSDTSDPTAERVAEYRLTPEETARIDALTGRDPVGLQLVAVAATRLFLSVLDEHPQHAILLPAPSGTGGEVALAAPLDLSAPVADFLTALHEELESSAALSWTDRSVITRRLELAGLPNAGALSQIAVVCEELHGSLLAPVALRLTVRRADSGLVVHADGTGGRPPREAHAAARCVAAAMAAISAQPQTSAGTIDVLGPEQRSELESWSGLPCVAEFPAATLITLTDVAAVRAPDRDAIADGTVSWSHRQLRQRSARAAALLTARHGIAAGSRVALLLPRGPELVLAVLAVLRTGASCVPLDPSHPPTRLARQLNLSQVACVISDRNDLPVGADLPVVLTGELADAPDAATPQPGPGPDDEAAVFFTSGSTGLPRPVALTHRQYAHKALSSGQLVGFADDTRCAMLSAVTSDGFFYEIFTTLVAGGCVVPVGAPQALSPHEFWSLLRERRVNTFLCVPSLLAVMAEGLSEVSEQGIRLCLLGGDEIPPGLLPRLAASLRVRTFGNLYGPTESTIEALTFLCSGERLDELTTVPIGRPSPGYGVVVVTERGDYAPVGVSGEIYVLGPAVAEGYLDEAPTGPGRFYELDSQPGVRAFRTGDFGRWNARGELEFLGRRDRQIKIHGNRLELGEIEAALSTIPEISAAVVIPVVTADEPPVLVAAYTAKQELPPPRVREALTAVLPAYMVPSKVLQLADIPLTSHGKVDRAAILVDVATADGGTWEPTDEVERLVFDVWSQVLGAPPTSADLDLFAAGGHSLTAALLAARLSGHTSGAMTITVRQVFAVPTPAGISEVLRDSAERPSHLPGMISPWPAWPEPLPASNAQLRMWFIEQYDEGDRRPYNMVEAFRLHDEHTEAALAAAVDQLLLRHQALRTVLRGDGADMVQVVLDPQQVTGELRTVAVPPGAMDEMLPQVVAAEQRWKVNMNDGPMLHAIWLKEDGAQGGILVISVHHSVCDGWSFAVVVRDLLGFLSPAGGEQSDPVQYGQYLQARRSLGDTAARDAESLAFWRHTLAELPNLDLPLDRPRPTIRNSAARVVRLSVDEDTAGELQRMCKAFGATPFMAMVAVIRVLLLRLCGAADAPIGTTVAGRDDPRLADSVGMFVNTVVLRTPVDPERGFRDLLTAVAHHAALLREHEEYPFDSLVEGLAIERTPSRHPLFDVFIEPVFPLVSPLDADTSARVEHVQLDNTVSGFDLAFSVETLQTGQPFQISITYREDVLEHQTVRRMAAQLRRLLVGLLADPEAPVGSVAILPDDQHDELLATAMGEQVDRPSAGTLLDLVTRQVERDPDARAVVSGERVLSYAELDRLSNNLAARLAAATGAGPGHVVGIVDERDEWLAIGLLAILKTGAAFLALDPEQPAARLSQLVSSSRATAVLAHQGVADSLDALGHTVLTLDENAALASDQPTPAVDAQSDDLAYVVYTSGSTGTPKGVMIEHGAILNTIQFRIDYYGLGPSSTVLQVSPVHCDSGISDVFSALGSGASLVVATREDLLSPEQVAELVVREQVTHAVMVPSLYELMTDYVVGALRRLQQLVLCGERVTETLTARHNRLLPTTELYNEYGPAEDAVLTTIHRLDVTVGRVSIGRPLPNKWVDLLDERGELVPLGGTGEICVGGAGLARGYWDAPDLTAHRFTVSPVRPGVRMYRTGDLARWLPDGTLQYLGRKDDQVKIRGNRVEPDEIAAVVGKAPGVRAAAVVSATGPDTPIRLVAYVVGATDVPGLRAFLSARLPAFMLPDSYLMLAALPRTANGKLDRRALPAPADDQAKPGTQPFTVAEQRIAEVWSAILGRPVDDLDARLFDLGGHSLTAARIATELGTSVRTVFANQTVRKLAVALAPETSTRPVSDGAPVRDASKPVPLARAQRRVWLTSTRMSPDVFVNTDLVRLGRRIDAATLRRALVAVVNRQEMLRAQVRAEGTTAELVVLDQEAVAMPLSVVELPDASPDGPEVAAAIRSARAVSFALDRAPLFAMRLITGPVGGDLLTVTAHHLVYDGASTQILLDDLVTAYELALTGERPVLPPLRYTYRDWVAEEESWLDGAEAREQERFWRERLDGVVESPDPVDTRRRGTKRGRTGVADRTLSADVLKRAPATPYAIVVTAFAATLRRRTHAEDLAIGCATSLRHRPEADAIVGFLANVVPVRLEMRQSDAKLGDLLRHVQERITEAYAHSRLPFDVIAEKLPLPARPGRSVLLDLGVSWGNAMVHSTDYVIEDVEPSQVTATSDLWLYGSLDADSLHLQLRYDDNLVHASEAESLIDQIAQFVGDVASGAAIPLADDAESETRDGRDSWGETTFEFE
ncbi:amino acid adenylation domain-containing protein [Nocardiopsis sp. NPDC006198]|uniref:amino acid adenylation domain-containing protein n=1 Tax=Nocardiopsis sp. NPDC006198 TaxID=3154472 RepID=UPI0033A654FC